MLAGSSSQPAASVGSTFDLRDSGRRLVLSVLTEVFPADVAAIAAAFLEKPDLWLRGLVEENDRRQLENSRVSVSYRTLCHFAKQGNRGRAVLDWIKRRMHLNADGVCLLANSYGNRYSEHGIYLAAGDNLDTVRWLLELGFPVDHQICIAVAKRGYFPVLRLLVKHGCPWNLRVVIESARAGNLGMLQWIFFLAHLTKLGTDNLRWQRDLCEAAASNTLGKGIEMLHWLRANKCEWDERVCARAASKGNFDMVKWAHDRGAPWDARTFSAAAFAGHLEMMKWLYTSGCPWDTWTCAQAAGSGLKILQWVRDSGCPWNEYTCYGAARRGDLATLKWARSNGCRWDSNACIQGTNNSAVVAWIKDEILKGDDYLDVFFCGRSPPGMTHCYGRMLGRL